MSGPPSSSSSATNALKSFSLMNNITEISPQDEIFRFDPVKNKEILKEQPWKNDPHYFKRCRISAVALIKMVLHARSGVPWEIMGLMQGKVIDNSLVIMDSFALPVQGTETRVNAQESANEYMVEYVGASEKVDRKENVIGWYHSHPGYACWLSGIDVNTQMSNQKYQDPFVAVVIDPNRTVSAGKVDIGAFRTYPENYTPPTSTSGGGSSGEPEYQSIPLSKIEDFGVHANQYYQLELDVFKSKLDDELLGLLWNKYWVDTLSSSALISNRAYAASQLNDLAQKLAKSQAGIANSRAPIPSLPVGPSPGDAAGSSKEKEKEEKGKAKDEKKKEDSQLIKSVRDSTKLSAEAQHGLITQVLKDVLFSSRPKAPDANVRNADVGAARLGKVIGSAMGVL